MPTHDLTESLDPTAVRAVVGAATTGGPDRFGLGLEVELFPMATRPRLRRVPIAGPAGVVARLATATDVLAAVDPGEAVGEAGWWSEGDTGFRVTFEPGGQLEVSSRYRPSLAAALEVAHRAPARLASVLSRYGIVLVAAGTDVWLPGTAPQQLRAPRYLAMDRYLAARGPAGRTMMRDTCALQLNLDLAGGTEAAARWIVTNLLSPVATATFANSPSPGGSVRSRRSLIWQRVDPTRTGFPRRLVEPRATLTDQLEQLAMDADVLMIVEAPGRALAGRPGWRFADWMEQGHPRLGWPTVDDLRTHLTTLFPEVRPRGFLEVRSIDALPARWRRVPAVLYAGATYDPRARDRILEVLTGISTPLLTQLRQAATVGVADPAWCARAVEVWSYALEGASRLPAGAVQRADLDLVEYFLERFTLRGRTPADELAGALASDGPLAAMHWAAEPGVGGAPTSSPDVRRTRSAQGTRR